MLFLCDYGRLYGLARRPPKPLFLATPKRLKNRQMSQKNLTAATRALRSSLVCHTAYHIVPDLLVYRPLFYSAVSHPHSPCLPRVVGFSGGIATRSTHDSRFSPPLCQCTFTCCVDGALILVLVLVLVRAGGSLNAGSGGVGNKTMAALSYVLLHVRVRDPAAS